MEFLHPDPEVERMPPSGTRVLDLHAEVNHDGKHVRVYLELTPFQQKPYLELTLINQAEEIVAATSIIEPVAWKMELNLHLRKSTRNTANVVPHRLLVILSFPELGEIDRRDLFINIPFTK